MYEYRSIDNHLLTKTNPQHSQKIRLTKHKTHTHTISNEFSKEGNIQQNSHTQMKSTI